MQKITLIIVLLIMLLSISPLKVQAHVLKSNASVGAVLHISPEDDPIAGQPSDFFFEFKDKENKFRPQNCDCLVKVYQDGKEIFSQPLFQNDPTPTLTDASFTFTFPQRDIYSLKVIGTPKSPSDFYSFTLEYDIRVTRQSTQPVKPSQIPDTDKSWLSQNTPYLAGVATLLFILTIGLISKSKLKRNP